MKNVIEFQSFKRKIDLVIQIIWYTGVGLLFIAIVLYTRRARDEYSVKRKMVPGSKKGKKSGATTDDDDDKVSFLFSKDLEKTVMVNANGVQSY